MDTRIKSLNLLGICAAVSFVLTFLNGITKRRAAPGDMTPYRGWHPNENKYLRLNLEEHWTSGHLERRTWWEW